MTEHNAEYVRVAKTDEEAAADHDAVFYDEGGPGETDGFPWAFAPDDSSFTERFATVEEAKQYAAKWLADRTQIDSSGSEES